VELNSSVYEYNIIYTARWIAMFDYIKELKLFILYHAFYTVEEFLSL
jgi:hypothetical protein